MLLGEHEPHLARSAAAYGEGELGVAQFDRGSIGRDIIIGAIAMPQIEERLGGHDLLRAAKEDFGGLPVLADEGGLASHHIQYLRGDIEHKAHQGWQFGLQHAQQEQAIYPQAPEPTQQEGVVDGSEEGQIVVPNCLSEHSLYGA